MARLISNSYARLTHFVTKHLKNLFPCNLRPFAIEIALAIFRHSPSCSHNNWIVTVDEMGCEVTSCKLNSPHLTPILRAAPPRAVKMSFCCVSYTQTFASHLVRKCSVTSMEFFFVRCSSQQFQGAVPVCLSVFTYEFVVYRTIFNQFYFIHVIHS